MKQTYYALMEAIKVFPTVCNSNTVSDQQESWTNEEAKQLVEMKTGKASPKNSFFFDSQIDNK